MRPSFASDRFSAGSISSAGLQEGQVAIAEGKENQREAPVERLGLGAGNLKIRSRLGAEQEPSGAL